MSVKFTFVCPGKHQAFETDDYRIVEDKGVKTDESGNKIWDAKVELTAACPFCGKRHTFPAVEVACPFG